MGQRVGIPGQDPGVEPSIRPVRDPQAGEIGDQRPAHQRHERGVPGERPGDLATHDRRCHRQRTRNVPGQAPQQRRGEHGGGEGQPVDQPPPGTGDGRTEVARQQDLVVRSRPAVRARPRPSQPEARTRARPREHDLRHVRARGHRHVGAACERIALRAQHDVAVERDGHLAAATRPQAVRTGARRPHLAGPAQGPFARGGQVTQIGTGDVDRAHRRGSDRSARVGHGSHQPRRRPQGNHHRQRRQDDEKSHQQRTHRAPRARTAGERGHDGEDHRGAGQGQRAHVEERARPHRRPTQHREHEQPDQDGDAGAREGGGDAPHARGRARPTSPLTRARRRASDSSGRGARRASATAR